MKKLSFFLMAMLVSLTSFAAALGEGYEKVTDISTLAAGDKVVLYCDDSSIGVTGVNGTKDAAVAATGWVEYLVEAATGGVKLKDTSASKYISLTTKNTFTYADSGSVCKVNANGVLCITLSGSDYFLYQNGTYYRMYVDKTGNSGYKPFYVYKVVPVEVDPDATMYTVTVKSADETMGTVTGGGEYAEGKTATLEATPKAGYEFVKWSNESTDNPLKLTVTEDIELTATFQAQTPITIAEALVLADGAACVLNPVTVVYVSGSYIYIEDESAYALAYKYNYGLVAGDEVTGLAITKSTYNGIAQFTPASAYADLTIAAGEAPAIDELTSAPTVADNHLVKLMNVKMEGEFTTSTSGTLVATCADETTINIYNNKVNAYTFVADKTYNIIGGVTQYKNVIQIQAYEIEEYVAPATETVYFVNAQGWDKVNIYTWTPEVGGWPGVAMTKEAEQLAGYDVYSYTVEKGTAFGGMLFNCGGDECKTGDLVWEAGKYYVIDGWYTKEEAEAKLAAPIADIWTVAGAPASIFGTEWDPSNAANDLVKQEDGTYKWEKADLTLATSSIQFKVVKNHAWGEEYPGSNYTLSIAEAGIYTITITFNADTKEVVGTATKTGSAVVIPTIAIAGDMNGWNTTANEFVVAADELTASLTLPLEAQDYGFKIIVAGGWTSNAATITRENNTAEFTENGDNSTLTADVAGEYTFTWTYATNTLVVTYPEKPEIEWIEMPLEISNLTTMEMPVGNVTYLQLMGRNDQENADVMLFLNDYTGEEKAYEVNVENSYMTFGGSELTVIDGSITQSVDPELGDTVYAGIVHASVGEDGETMYVAFDLKMYALPSIAIELEDVEIVVNEESAIAFFNATWEGSPLQVEVSGFEEIEFKEYPECWLSIGDSVNWVDAAAGPAAVIIEDGVAMLEGEFTSFSTGKTYEVMLTGTLPVKEEPALKGVVKRALTIGESTVVLTHEADGTPHIYNIVGEEIAEISLEGVVPVDPENKGSYLAISDIAATEDGKLIANNYVRCQFGTSTAPGDGYKRGTSYYYIWNDLAGAPAVWFTSQTTARSSHGDVGRTFAVKGTSTNAKVLVTAVHNNNRAVRMSLHSIIDGVYEDPNIDGGIYDSEYYMNFGLHTTANYYKEATQGKEFYLLASPLADASWIIEGELSEPSEFLVPAEVGADYAANQEIAAGTLGNKYQGTTIVTVGEQHLMVAPYADAEGKLAGVKVLDITAGLDAATEVATADLDAAVEATAAATAVAVAENALTITLVADATIYTLNVELPQGPGTALENIAVEGKAVKAIVNGQLIIIKNGVQYNAQGAVVK